ncbi:hypothetical protein D9M72_199760 [compost metagenome]
MMRKGVLVRHERNFHAALQQRIGDHARDLRAFPLVRRGERFVEQHHRVRRDFIDDGAHSFQFLVELSALHRGVFFPLVVRVQPLAQIGGKGRRAHEHAALHHQLGQADAAQERRLASLVGAGHDHQAAFPGIQRVGHHFLPHLQRQAHVVQFIEAVLPRSRSGGLGKADRPAQRRQPVAQVDAAHVERQLGAQQGEEAGDVLRRLRQRVGHQVQAPVGQFRQGPRAVLVARRQRVLVHLGLLSEQARQPIALVPQGRAQHIAGAAVALAQMRAHQDAAAELQRLQVTLDLLDIAFVQFVAQHREQPFPPFGRESGFHPLCRVAQLAQHGDEEFYHLHRAVQDGQGVMQPDAPVALLLRFEGVDGKLV